MMRAAEQDRPDVKAHRKRWRQQQTTWDVRRLVFIDESGVNTKMARLYGRSLSNERCVDKVPHGHWKTSTFIAALRHDRIDAPMIFDGPMNGQTFLHYIRLVLVPTLKPGDLVICDNLSSHKTQGVREALQAAGADIEYLPAYSPDLNPIELAFAKIKSHLRAKAVRSLDMIIQELGEALKTFCSKTCSNLFRHANYASM